MLLSATSSRIRPMMDSLMNPSFLVGVGCGVCFSFAVFFNKLRSQLPSGVLESMGPELSNNEDVKLVLVVRNDLRMGKGKCAAQCAHAAVSAFKQAKKRQPKVLQEWESNGQPKIVVKCDTEVELIELSKRAAEKNLVCSMIRDAGRTQIASGSRTVLGVGPGPASLIDEVTGHLKLY